MQLNQPLQKLKLLIEKLRSPSIWVRQTLHANTISKEPLGLDAKNRLNYFEAVKLHKAARAYERVSESLKQPCHSVITKRHSR